MNHRVKIVCATNMPYALEAFGTLGDARIIEGRIISPDDVRHADILAVRSTTRVDRDLLDGSRVGFVGTATIGTDHFDIPYLEGRGIRWCYAPGCNANSVSEYVTAALLCLARRHGFRLRGLTIGVIGVGNVGNRVVGKATALGLQVLQNDPPRQEATGASVFQPLDSILPQTDIVTLHVPLTSDGRHPTIHMADRRFFDRLKHGCILVNAARGAVVDTDALLRAMDRGIVSHAVIDTWEPEPAYRTDLLARADLATPHIAGHSFEGKVNGTVMVYREACRFLGVPDAWTPDGLLPPPLVPQIEVDAAEREDEDALWEVVRRVYDIEADDARMRAGIVADDRQRSKHFDRLRSDYPMRREFPFTRVQLQRAGATLRGTVADLGFRTSEQA